MRWAQFLKLFPIVETRSNTFFKEERKIFSGSFAHTATLVIDLSI